MDYSNLTRWNKRDPITAARLNDMNDAVRRDIGQTGQYLDAKLNVIARGTRSGNVSIAGTELVWALVIEEVPPAEYTITGTPPAYLVTCAHGYLEDAVILMRRTEDNTGWEADLDEYEDPIVLACVNPSQSELRGSVASPVMMLGYLTSVSTTFLDEYDEEQTEDNECFVAINWDMSSLHGHDDDFDPSQVPYHLSGSREFILGSRECEDAGS